MKIDKKRKFRVGILDMSGNKKKGQTNSDLITMYAVQGDAVKREDITKAIREALTKMKGVVVF